MILLLLGACSLANHWKAGAGGRDVDTGLPGDSATGGVSTGALLLSEILVNPEAVSDDWGEWIEITNLSAEAQDLAGLTLTDGGENTWQIPVSLELTAGARAVLGASADLAQNGGSPVNLSWGDALKLGNDGDTLRLSSGDLLLDAVTWDDGSLWPVSAGVSMSLSAQALSVAGNDDPGSWCLSTEPYGDGDLGTPGVANGACASPPRAPVEGDLVLTEIMANPDPDDDGDAEWIEIQNLSTDALVLDGLKVEDEADDAFTLDGVTLEAGGTLVLGASDQEDDNGGYAPDAVWPEDSFQLKNDEDEVILTLDGTFLDAVRYDDAFPGKSGHAMQLDPGASSPYQNDDADQWCNAEPSYGSSGERGTPGSVNPSCG